MATWKTMLKAVSNDVDGSLAHGHQMTDYNELARRIEMMKQDLERAIGRERQAYDAARKAQAATEEMRDRLKEMNAQWKKLTSDLMTFSE